MRIMVVGPIVPEKEVLSGKRSTLACNKFLIGLVNGFQSNMADVETVSVHTLPLFPKDSSIKIRKEKLSVSDNIQSTIIPYINFPILREISMFITMFTFSSRWLRTHKGENERFVFIYNMKTPIPAACKLATHIFGGKVVGLIADLPFNYDFEIHGAKYHYGAKGFMKYLQIMDRNEEIGWLRKMDAIVTLSRLTIEDFKYKKPYLVMEGGINDLETFRGVRPAGHKEYFTAMFNGSLYPIHGIKILLDAWGYLSDKYHLIICGRGSDENIVKEFAKKYSNIEFKGVIPYRELLELQHSVDLLLVPHPTGVKHVRYQFPSKLLEYMNSGTPVLTTPLETIPNEYKAYLYYSKDDAPQSFAEAIQEVSEVPEKVRLEKGYQAQQFVIDKKNWGVQAKNIINFFKNIK